MQELERPDCPRQSKKSKTVWITFVLASLLEHHREEEEEEERVIGLYRSGLATNRFQVGLLTTDPAPVMGAASAS